MFPGEHLSSLLTNRRTGAIVLVGAALVRSDVRHPLVTASGKTRVASLYGGKRPSLRA